MKKITMIAAVALVVLSIAEAQASPDRQSRREARQSRRGVVVNGQSWQPVQESATAAAASPEATAGLTGSDDAMDEVNAKRATKGLPPLQKDPLLSQAALACAKQRAARNIHGHLPESDFSYLPPGAHATVGGCGALEDFWGWETCAYDSTQYTVGGAAWIRGPGNRRFMHFFGR